ncbi:MAG: hypothetical protein ABL895_14140 [Cyclobacteriaceae bacterium]
MKEKIYQALELTPIVLASLAPLFADLTYQINLYLTWEGAYRLYMGEIPYRDFGIPMGFCYWILPAIFFKILGPTLLTLAKTQAFINLISGFSFRWILVNLEVGLRARFLSILVFSITYIWGLYWPQYNHTVIVFQFLAIGFMLHYIKHADRKYGWLYLVIANLFITVAFFTKQDAGGLALLIILILITYYSFNVRSSKPILITLFSVLIFFCLAVVPFLKYDFAYWFNYGQEHHNSRIAIMDILRINMEESRWEKLYLLIVLGIGLIRWKKSQLDSKEIVYILLVLGILFEAMIFQVTSYVPRDNNIFFHAFACSYIFYHLERLEIFAYKPVFLTFILLVSLWWSEKYWKYADRILSKAFPAKTKENSVSINNYILSAPECNIYADFSSWRKSDLNSFEGVKMPKSTSDGINRFLFVAKKLKSPIVLNMSELTPLANEVPYSPQKGSLWYHLGVGMFNRELNELNSKIESTYYDLVLFENIPMLNNFYPFSIRQKLLQNYQLIDSFEAPRTVYPGTIEVYSRKGIF